MFVKENLDKKKKRKKEKNYNVCCPQNGETHIKNHLTDFFIILWTPGILVISHIASTVFECSICFTSLDQVKVKVLTIT